MKKILISTIAGLFLMSCNNNNDESKMKQLEDEVMAVHDEVMPKMGEIMDLKSKLTESLKELDSTSAQYSALKQKTDSLKTLLDVADTQMMDWMNQYNPDTLNTLDIEQATKYLTDQKNKITMVKDNTLKNIEPAKQYLNKK
jgi:chromosome segregation ATPase